MNTKRLFELLKDEDFVITSFSKGNWGDELIRYGTLRLAKNVGLNYVNYINKIEKFPQSIIYLRGCGYGLFSPSNIIPVLKLLNLNPDKLVVVGPSSVVRNSKVWKKLLPYKDRIIFFARELTSHIYMKENIGLPRVYLDVCPSFHLKFRAKVGNKKCLFVRTDGEGVKLPSEINPKDFDVFWDPAFAGSFSEWVNLHKQASLIVTNRCHSAILGTILKKEVKMFRNAYHKNRSIWKFCLRQRGVKWIGDASTLPLKQF